MRGRSQDALPLSRVASDQPAFIVSVVKCKLVNSRSLTNKLTDLQFVLTNDL